MLEPSRNLPPRSGRTEVPIRMEKITTRALSILLYRDSKRLENLLSLCKPLLSRAGKIITVPDLSFLERSYPETMISGKITIEYKNEKTPLVNSGSHILGLPLENAEEILSIHPASEKMAHITHYHFAYSFQM